MSEVKVPTAIAYMVNTPKGIAKVVGTHAYVVDGALVIQRPIFMDPEFKDQEYIAGRIFASGKWIEAEYLAGGYWPEPKKDETPAEPETPNASD